MLRAETEEKEDEDARPEVVMEEEVLVEGGGWRAMLWGYGTKKGRGREGRLVLGVRGKGKDKVTKGKKRRAFRQTK